MSDQSERDDLQRGVFDFVTTWYEGFALEYEGVRLGECLEYNLTQLMNGKVLEQLRQNDQS